MKLLISNGMKGVMEDLAPQCEKAIGAPLAIQYSSTFGLRKKIEAGEVFDATVITSEAITALTKQGKLAEGSSAYLGRSPLGIGIRTGARKPDIRTGPRLSRHCSMPSRSHTRKMARRGASSTTCSKSWALPRR